MNRSGEWLSISTVIGGEDEVDVVRNVLLLSPDKDRSKEVLREDAERESEV